MRSMVEGQARPVKILPGTGRGTARRVVEGQASQREHPTQPHRSLGSHKDAKTQSSAPPSPNHHPGPDPGSSFLPATFSTISVESSGRTLVATRGGEVMTNFIELAKALGWPIAITIAAACLLAVVLRITSKKGSLKVGVKDWFNFETGSAIIDDAADSRKISPQNETLSLPKSDTDSDPKSNDVPPSGEVDDPVHFIFAKNADDLEKAFEAFKSKEAFLADMDFWHSTYVDKRREFGVAEESDFSKLAEANPGWVWPIIYLIRRHVRIHEADKAVNCLEQALSRSNDSNLRYVLSEGVRLYEKLFGLERAMQFVVEQLQSPIGDRDIAKMFREFANVNPSDDIFSTILYREIASSLDFDKSELFDIAYAYGQFTDTNIVSFERYRELYWRDEGYVSATNNMGVIISSDLSVATDYFEKAIASGDAMAHANLARNLAHAGYVARAEKLLEEAPSVTLSPESEVALADARAKVSAARKKVDEERDRLEKHAKEQDTKYKSLIFSAFSRLRTRGEFSIDGLFVSEDDEIGILGGIEVRVGLRLGDDRLFGTLESKGLCFEGKVRRKGLSLLDFSETRIVAVRVSDDEVRVILFPNGFGLDKKSRVISLYRSSTEQSAEDEVVISMAGLLMKPSA